MKRDFLCTRAVDEMQRAITTHFPTPKPVKLLRDGRVVRDHCKFKPIHGAKQQTLLILAGQASSHLT